MFKATDLADRVVKWLDERPPRVVPVTKPRPGCSGTLAALKAARKG